MAMAANMRGRSHRQPVSQDRRDVAVANLIRGIAGALLAAAVVLLALPAPTLAGCATIPKPPVEFAWRRGRIDRVFISPGDTVRITIDTPEDPTARSAAAMG